ncbi:hypothetical protein CMI47_19290 [Candidatus Pacearchaeota archaeon]|nr:hypothetical protein [Candidatus Pacearchaeota archaeon]
MNTGDLVRWSWYLSTDWATTHFTGIIVDSSVFNTSFHTSGTETIRVFDVLDDTGQVVRVRADEQSLEVIT